MSDALSERLAREPAEVECSICRHRQYVSAATGRCDQCGSGIEVVAGREAGLQRMEALSSEGRAAYLVEVRRPVSARGLYAVVANRRFPSGG
ncbi:MAG TPA: hypothetical protein VM778_14235 [Gemmatimonadota bacterium]|nr:hypothetical protein [Gemmatimonadota bacterium]